MVEIATENLAALPCRMGHEYFGMAAPAIESSVALG